MPSKAFWLGLFVVVVTTGLILVNFYYWNRYKYPPPAGGQTAETSPEASPSVIEYSLSGTIKSVTPNYIVFDYTGTLEQKYEPQEKEFLVGQATIVSILTQQKSGNIVSSPAKISDVRAGAQAIIYAPVTLTGVNNPYLSRIDLIK